MKRKVIACLVGVAIWVSAILAIFVWRAWRQHEDDRLRSSCISDLHMIAIAKEVCSIKRGLTNGTTVEWKDIEPYLEGDRSWYRCPAGGTQSLGRIGEPPTCSIGGDHVYNPDR